MEQQNNEQVQKILGISITIIELLFMNILIVLISVGSMFLLMPVSIASFFNVINRILHKETDGLLYEYFRFWKGRTVKSILLGFPFVVILIALAYLFFFLNPQIAGSIQFEFYGVIIGLQLLVSYELLSTFLIMMIKFDQYPSNSILIRNSLLLVNAYPLRAFIAFLSSFLIPLLLLRVSMIFIFLVVAIALFAYRIAIMPIINKI